MATDASITAEIQGIDKDLVMQFTDALVQSPPRGEMNLPVVVNDAVAQSLAAVQKAY